MNQNTTHVFKAEDLDWNQLEALGIYEQSLEKSGNLELLLQGKESDIVSLKLRTPVLYVTMDAVLKITEGPNGKPIVEINGLDHETPAN